MKRICLAILLLLAGCKMYSQKRYALVVGNSNYLFGAGPRHSINDARLIGNKLKECGFTVSEKEDLSRVSFTKAIEDFYNQIKYQK